MSAPEPFTGWHRYVLTRSSRTRTTLSFRLALVASLLLGGWLTAGWWTRLVGEGLVCEASAERSDALLIENFDPQYLLFERAEQLRRAGVATRVLVPVRREESGTPNGVMLGMAELMARIARLEQMEVVPIREVEPISLNAANDVLTYLQRTQLRSVTVVTPIFRSRRSAMVYAAVFGPAGITVRCEAVQGTTGVENWTTTWHGIQGVAEQWGKLQYYRLFVLPVHGAGTARSDRTGRS
jgi:hypothetical protein